MNPLALVPALSWPAKVAFVVILAAGGYLYGRLHEARAHEARLAEFVAQVAEQGAAQAKRTAATIAAQQRITLDAEARHAKDLAAALDAGWRERVRANAATRGERLPAVPVAAGRADAAASDAVALGGLALATRAELARELEEGRAAYWRLAEQCVGTTSTLVALQAWVADQAGLER